MAESAQPAGDVAAEAAHVSAFGTADFEAAAAAGQAARKFQFVNGNLTLGNVYFFAFAGQLVGAAAVDFNGAIGRRRMCDLAANLRLYGLNFLIFRNSSVVGGYAAVAVGAVGFRTPLNGEFVLFGFVAEKIYQIGGFS